jgi:hypothetical protein
MRFNPNLNYLSCRCRLLRLPEFHYNILVYVSFLLLRVANCGSLTCIALSGPPTREPWHRGFLTDLFCAITMPWCTIVIFNMRYFTSQASRCGNTFASATAFVVYLNIQLVQCCDVLLDAGLQKLANFLTLIVGLAGPGVRTRAAWGGSGRDSPI